MPNGAHGDHPLTDILFHKLPVYGAEPDELIRKIAALCSRQELDEWWEREIGWSDDHSLALRKAKARYEQLAMRARESGWETNEDA